MKVVFLDRDGVINQDSPDYIKSWSEFHFIPKSLDALAALTRHGFSIVLITNQSIIGRGMATRRTLDEIHDNMTRAVAAHGGKIHAIFFCPHTPDDNCSCRKPRPGLILQAQKEFSVNLSDCAMIGDSEKDIQTARNAGCGLAILVRTGNGNQALQTLEQKASQPDYVATDLLDAATWLIGREGSPLLVAGDINV